MSFFKIYLSILFLFTCMLHAQGQEESSGTSVGVSGGVFSYQGDLQPTSFSFRESKAVAGVFVRQPLFHRFSLKAGLNLGRLYADDKNNRDYAGEVIKFDNKISKEMQSALFDPQTAGGLLISLEADKAEQFIKEVKGSAIIGRVENKNNFLIEVE